jgi:uncharacterized membrane protein
MTTAAAAYAGPATFCGTSVPKMWNVPVRRSLFGDAVLLLFLLTQCFDGVFTYVGVTSYGIGIEANPLIATLMAYLGHGMALMGAKTVAATLGIGLHLRQMHAAVALLAAFYVVVAVLPWMAILFG